MGRAVRRRVVRFEEWVVRAETVAGIALVLVIVVAVLVQVVMRYVFASPNPWTEELSRFAFIWLSSMGAALATKTRSHFALESVVAWLSPATRALVDRVVTLIVVVLLGTIAATGSALAYGARLERSPARAGPMRFVYAAMPLSAALMLLHVAVHATAAEEGEREWASR